MPEAPDAAIERDAVKVEPPPDPGDERSDADEPASLVPPRAKRVVGAPATFARPPSSSIPWLRIGRGALIAVALVYLGSVLLAPMGALVVELFREGIGEAAASLVEPRALRALGMSIALMVIALVVNAVVGTVGAIAIARHRFVGRRIVNALADLPLALSPVMVALAFLLLFGREGWLGPVLEAVDLKVVFAFPGLVLATLFVTLPFTIREVAYVLEEIGTSEEEAAATLGASPWQTFWRITLPNIRYGLGYGLLMTAARSLGEFGAVLVLGGSIAGHTQTATTYIHDAVEERELAGAHAMAVVLACVAVCLLVALEWSKRKKQGRKEKR
jgi:sulfate/thiosulfate transport system permease protein